ncbi:hypothetical protein, partial [Heliobacterium chlorum]|uniref:hypothetical protein n=1 Tax=Heliobacterium chlorum TaxID=2698 RepID=UPI001A9AEA96
GSASVLGLSDGESLCTFSTPSMWANCLLMMLYTIGAASSATLRLACVYVISSGMIRLQILLATRLLYQNIQGKCPKNVHF